MDTLPVPPKGHSPLRHLAITILFATLTIGVALLLWSLEMSFTKQSGTPTISAETLYDAGNIDGAVAQAEATTPSLTSQVALSLLYSQKAFLTGDTTYSQKAEVTAQKVVADYPTESEGYRALGYAYEVEGKLADAVAAYNKGLALTPTNATLISYLGHAFDQQGKTSDAQYSYERALALDPTLVHAKLNLARLYAATESDAGYTKAVELAQQVLKDSGQTFVHAEAEMIFGAALLGQGKFVDAEQQYRNALKDAPSSDVAALGVAWAQFYELRTVTDKDAALSKVKDIFAQIKGVLAHNASNANAYYLGGLVNVYLSKSAEAKTILTYTQDTVIPIDTQLNVKQKKDMSEKISKILATLK